MNEIVEWKQSDLGGYFSQHIDTMEKAVTVGLVLKDVGKRCEIAIGKLANHVEKGKWGGGISAFAKGIGLPISTVHEWMQATATPELSARAENLGTKKVAIVERAPEPTEVWDWIDAQEEVPTVMEIKTHLAKDDPMARCRALSERAASDPSDCYSFSKFLFMCDYLRANGECPDGYTLDKWERREWTDRRFF